MRDINALNLSQPYNNKTFTPMEEMFGRASLVNGIPMTEEIHKDLVDNDLMADKIQKVEDRGSNPMFKGNNSSDRHQPNREENDISSD